MAGQPIDIIASRYVAQDGTPVAFDTVVRSFAPSAQSVATVPDDRQTLRLQMKYSPAPASR